jgi:hypothetical protein
MLSTCWPVYRKLPLSLRKLQLARLLRSRSEGIFLAPFEQGEIGPDLFRHVCEFGFEGFVSKRRLNCARLFLARRAAFDSQEPKAALLFSMIGWLIARQVAFPRRQDLLHATKQNLPGRNHFPPFTKAW